MLSVDICTGMWYLIHNTRCALIMYWFKDHRNLKVCSHIFFYEYQEIIAFWGKVLKCLSFFTFMIIHVHVLYISTGINDIRNKKTIEFWLPGLLLKKCTELTQVSIYFSCEMINCGIILICGGQCSLFTLKILVVAWWGHIFVGNFYFLHYARQFNSFVNVSCGRKFVGNPWNPRTFILHEYLWFHRMR